MGYKLNGADLKPGVAFKDSDGTNYPANWLLYSSKAERAAVPTGGITWVDSFPELFDSVWYSAVDTPIKSLADAKAEQVQNQKDAAKALLQDSDWYIIRKEELTTAIPSSITTYRASVRTQCKAREDAVNACSDYKTLHKTIRENTLPAWPNKP